HRVAKAVVGSLEQPAERPAVRIGRVRDAALVIGSSPEDLHRPVARPDSPVDASGLRVSPLLRADRDRLDASAEGAHVVVHLADLPNPLRRAPDLLQWDELLPLVTEALASIV